MITKDQALLDNRVRIALDLLKKNHVFVLRCITTGIKHSYIIPYYVIPYYTTHIGIFNTQTGKRIDDIGRVTFFKLKHAKYLGNSFKISVFKNEDNIQMYDYVYYLAKPKPRLSKIRQA